MRGVEGCLIIAQVVPMVDNLHDSRIASQNEISRPRWALGQIIVTQNTMLSVILVVS